MVLDENYVNSFLKSAEQAAKIISEVAAADGVIHVFSHLDADGVAAAGILGKVLSRLDARFRIQIMQWVDEKIIQEVTNEKPELLVFSDFGSGYIDFLKQLPETRIVVLDHHQIVGEEPRIIQVNPHAHQIDGARDVSGAGVTYFVAKAINERNIDLASVAVVGALGDLQDKYGQRQLCGLNERIVTDAVNSGLMIIEKDLILFGRETRPLHRTLASTTSPFIPGISGEEDNAYAFLANLGIKLKINDKWRALRDLSQDEKQQLCSSLADHLLSKGLHYEVTNLIGDIYILIHEEPWTPLRDAREYAVLLNATGRMDRPSLGVAVCMGDRTAAFDEATKVLDDYRKAINKYLVWVTEKPERLKELANIYVVDGEDYIDDKIVGAISSILSSSLANPEKPLIAYAHVEDEGLVKVSARTIDMMTKKGVNLGEVMQLAAEKLEGKGGGHNVAAGAQVPIGKVIEFIEIVDKLVGEQLREGQVGSKNNA